MNNIYITQRKNDGSFVIDGEIGRMWWSKNDLELMFNKKLSDNWDDEEIFQELTNFYKRFNGGK